MRTVYSTAVMAFAAKETVAVDEIDILITHSNGVGVGGINNIPPLNVILIIQSNIRLCDHDHRKLRLMFADDL